MPMLVPPVLRKPHMPQIAPQGFPAQGLVTLPPVPMPPVAEPLEPPVGREPPVPPMPPVPPLASPPSPSSPDPASPPPIDVVPLQAPTTTKTPASAGKCQILIFDLYPFLRAIPARCFGRSLFFAVMLVGGAQSRLSVGPGPTSPPLIFPGFDERARHAGSSERV